MVDFNTNPIKVKMRSAAAATSATDYIYGSKGAEKFSGNQNLNLRPLMKRRGLSVARKQCHLTFLVR